MGKTQKALLYSYIEGWHYLCITHQIFLCWFSCRSLLLFTSPFENSKSEVSITKVHELRQKRSCVVLFTIEWILLDQVNTEVIPPLLSLIYHDLNFRFTYCSFHSKIQSFSPMCTQLFCLWIGGWSNCWALHYGRSY